MLRVRPVAAPRSVRLVGAGADGAAEVEEDHQPDEHDRDEDPEHEHPSWCGAGRVAAGPGVVVPFGFEAADRVCQYGSPPQGVRFPEDAQVIDTWCRLSNHDVSTIVIPYTPHVPRLWTETIDAHRREVRGAIMDTTAALVAEHGLRSVTMSQIAEETGIGRATLYKYFPDVEAILRAWHARQITGHLEHLAEVRDRGADAGERLEAVLEAYALVSRGSRGHHDTEFAAFLHRDEEVARAQRQVHDLIRDLLTAAAAIGDVRDDVAPDELASYCVHALGGAGARRSNAAVRRLVTVTLAGLRPPVRRGSGVSADQP